MAEVARSAAYRRGVVGRTFGHLLDSERVFGYAIGAMAWNWMLNPTYSVINWVGTHFGLFQYGPNWLGEEKYAMASIILVNVWRNLPFTAIVLTAGISAVPQEIIEAANLDGARFLTRYRKIMVPIIAPILYIALLFSLVFTFTDMTVVWLLTRGNPVNARTCSRPTRSCRAS